MKFSLLEELGTSYLSSDSTNSDISPLVDNAYARGGRHLNVRKEEMQENKENIDGQH